MSEQKAAFEVTRRSDGHVWKVYEDGRIEGFEGEMIVFNRIRPRIEFLLSMLAQAGGQEAADAARRFLEERPKPEDVPS